MVLYSFIPYIKYENDSNLKKVYDLRYDSIRVENNEDFLKIFHWYQIQINKLSHIFDIEIKNISYVLHKKIYFVSKQRIHEYLLEDFIDPNSNGNYPLILSDNQNYLIFGKEIYIIDHS